MTKFSFTAILPDGPEVRRAEVLLGQRLREQRAEWLTRTFGGTIPASTRQALRMDVPWQELSDEEKEADIAYAEELIELYEKERP